MNPVPICAFILVTVVLLVVWFFLVHMIRSRQEDARLHFLLDLMQDPPPFAGHPVTLPQNVPVTEDEQIRHPAVGDVSAWTKLSLLSAVALRGRSM
jgi:hypothetical protein